MKKIVLILISFLATFNTNVFCDALKTPRAAGDVLIYEDTLITQTIDGSGNFEIYSKYCDEMVRVQRTITKRAEKLADTDNGLKYGFPLRVGLEWDKFDNSRTDHMYCYYVEKIEDITVPAGTFKNCFKIVYETCPDDEAEWYCPGVGIVKYEYHHHGTITNERHELKEIR